MGLIDTSKPIEVRIFGARDSAMNHDWRDGKIVKEFVVKAPSNNGRDEKWVFSDHGEIWYQGHKIGEVRNKEERFEAPRSSGIFFGNGVLEYRGDVEHFNEDMHWLWMRNMNELHCIETVRISKELNKELLKKHQEFMRSFNQEAKPNAMGYAYGFKIEVIDQVYIAEPPLGLTPKTIWQTMRKEQILDAMKRYTKEGKAIPKVWIQELEELNCQPIMRFEEL